MTPHNRLALACLVALAGSALPAAAPQATDQAAREIVSRAITAHGGAERLVRYPVAHVVSRGTLIGAGGREVGFTDERDFRLPDHCRTAMRLEQGLKTTVLVQAVRGDKADGTLNGRPVSVNEHLRTEVLDGLYVQQLCRLVPLLGPEFRLELLPEESNRPVAGREVVGVRVGHPGRRDVKLYFDKQSCLLVKAERRRVTADGLEFPLEQYFFEHKDFDGVLRPTRTVVWQDETKLLESEILSYTEYESVPEETFAP